MACLLAALAWQAGAAPLSDAELDARAHTLSQQLRCLVCQNQTLADSNADLAVDLRRQIRAQLAQGASDTAIKEYLVQRYGDFVLYDPPFKRSTWLLWLGPFGLLMAVAGWLWWRWTRLPSPPAPCMSHNSVWMHQIDGPMLWATAQVRGRARIGASISW